MHNQIAIQNKRRCRWELSQGIIPGEKFPVCLSFEMDLKLFFYAAQHQAGRKVSLQEGVNQQNRDKGNEDFGAS